MKESPQPNTPLTPLMPDTELVQGRGLWEALGYRTGEAFRAAARSKRTPVPLIKIEGRRGWFARRADVTAWQSSVRADFDLATKKGKTA